MNNNKIKKNKIIFGKNGFTLLLSLIVVTSVLSVGLGVFEIIRREIRISSIGRESQIAFYAANAGAECAFYLEIIQPSTRECAGNDAISSGNSYNFDLRFSSDSTPEPLDPCVHVEVYPDSNDSNITIIESRGYNMACNSNSSIKVERAVKLSVKKSS